MVEILCGECFLSVCPYSARVLCVSDELGVFGEMAIAPCWKEGELAHQTMARVASMGHSSGRGGPGRGLGASGAEVRSMPASLASGWDAPFSLPPTGHLYFTTVEIADEDAAMVDAANRDEDAAFFKMDGRRS
eukprot:Gb_16284 [translate_table: standard]